MNDPITAHTPISTQSSNFVVFGQTTTLNNRPNKNGFYLFFQQSILIFFLFLHKNICCGCTFQHISSVILMSALTLCFCGQIRRIFYLKVFFYFSMKTCHTGTHWNPLSEVIPVNTRNICFCGKNIIASVWEEKKYTTNLSNTVFVSWR